MAVRLMLAVFFLMIISRVSLVTLNLPSKSNGFQIATGFSITQVAGTELASDIYCITFSPSGDLLASGRGYIKQFSEPNADGKYQKYCLIADHPQDGAMGLLVDKDTLYAVGDGGLRRMPWQPGKYQPTSEILFSVKTGGEHDAHAIRKGPDGNFYLLLGNTAANSLKSLNQQMVGGGVLKFSSEFSKAEVICDGLRNAYDMDWDRSGNLYTFDSDNERCLGLPWYEGCRFYQIKKGAHYGWRTPQYGQFWRLPSYHARCMPPVLDLGRGSPTGVTAYRHQQFPEQYHNNWFLLDWTFGVIHRVFFQEGRWQAEKFLESMAGHGFAPTSAAIHPKTGDLYVASGGRGIAGAIYRIRHDAGFQSKLQITNLLEPKAIGASLQSTSEKPTTEISVMIENWKKAKDNEEELYWLTSIQAELGIPGSKNREQLFLEGYDYYLDAMKKLSTEQYKDILTLFDQRFPTSDTRLNREYSRLMGLLKDTRASTTEVILKQITPASAGVEDIHYLMVLAALNTKLSAEQLVIVTDALIKLEAKYLQKQVLRERNWFIRLREVVEILIKHNPLLANSIAQHPHFGQANQLLYLTTEVVPSQNLISRLEKIITDDPDYVWSSRLIEILSHAPTPATLEKFRDKWMEEPHLRVSLLPVLAKHPKEQDRHIFMDGLKLSDDRCVQISIVALSLLTEPNPENRDKEIAILIQRLRQDNSKKLNDLIQNRLRELTLKQSPPATLQLGRDWESWATQQYPSMVPWLHNSEGTPLVTWKLQHPHLDWNKADLISGERLYQKYCSACHRGSSALGPDLSGIGRRFSRDDILTAILQPSKDVSSRYRTSIIVAKDGKVHSGLIIYEAVDGVILQTSADSTVRILGDQIESRRLSDRSLMPAGLLDGLTDQEIASLIGWLQMQ